MQDDLKFKTLCIKWLIIIVQWEVRAYNNMNLNERLYIAYLAFKVSRHQINKKISDEIDQICILRRRHNIHCIAAAVLL